MVGGTTNPPSSICYRTCTPGGFLGGSPCSHPYPAPRLGGYCTAPTPPPRGHPVLGRPPTDAEGRSHFGREIQTHRAWGVAGPTRDKSCTKLCFPMARLVLPLKRRIPGEGGGVRRWVPSPCSTSAGSGEGLINNFLLRASVSPN